MKTKKKTCFDHNVNTITNNNCIIIILDTEYLENKIKQQSYVLQLIISMYCSYHNNGIIMVAAIAIAILLQKL